MVSIKRLGCGDVVIYASTRTEHAVDPVWDRTVVRGKRVNPLVKFETPETHVVPCQISLTSKTFNRIPAIKDAAYWVANIPSDQHEVASFHFL